MNGRSVRQHQQSEIFLILFLVMTFALVFTAGQDKPPIITLPEASGYRFRSGSAELETEFRNKLRDEIMPQLETIAKEFNVDVIEVIGHTDGQVVSALKGNLDTELEVVAAAGDPSYVRGLVPSSNADLGLMRAISVIKFLQHYQKSGRLHGIKFRPYSAAQLILPDGQLAKVERWPNAARRRIEIRFTRDVR
jgi:hypothetical protein